MNITAQESYRVEVITELIARELTNNLAAKKLGISKRQVQRMKKRVLKYGPAGLIHAGRGKASNRRIDAAVIAEAAEYIQKLYPDFKPTFATEKLAEVHGIKISKERVRGLMIELGLWKSRIRKENSEYRSWRPRKEHLGELEQFDGSYHLWFENRAPEACLLAAIDDASGRITRAVFADNEGVVAVSTFWREYVREHGKPVAVYLDKFGTYKINHKSAVDNHELMTQFQGMMQRLDIRLISAHSPQAKGRVERLFGTLQDRLVKELRLTGISDTEAANVFLEKTFLPDFNTKFSVAPAADGDAHRQLSADEVKNLDSIFSIRTQRTIGNDFVVRFEGAWLQLARVQSITVLRHETVVLEKRLDGSLHMSLRGVYLVFEKLPERPVKVKEKITALVRAVPAPSRPVNTPWRKPFLFGKNQRRY